MPSDVVVLPTDDHRWQHLRDAGWQVTARSWAALVHVTPMRMGTWRAAVARLPATDTIRDLSASDALAILALDAATSGDYPGSVATAHVALTAEDAVPTARRRGFGVFDADGGLVAMTFIDVDLEGDRAEVDFTVVARHRRRQGVATALKAASLLALAHHGVTFVRTGGSDENPGILASNRSLGFRVDERWVTVAPPAR